MMRGRFQGFEGVQTCKRNETLQAVMEKIVKAEVRCMHVDVCVFLYMGQLLVAFSALTVEYFVRLVLR